MSDQPTPSPAVPITSTNEFVEVELVKRLNKIETATSSHTLAFSGPIFSGTDDWVREVIEARRHKSNDTDRLVVLLTTTGGQVEPVQRIVETIRHFYSRVSFVVPNYAYSAGTILCMSGDEIYMDYYSRLGPIDPQVRNRNGSFVPALGYLRRWEAFLEKEASGRLTTAELQVMLNFDQAELYMYEQAEQQSISLLEEWLVRYKFSKWNKTESKGTRVTEKKKKARAVEIATLLNDTNRWHSHGHGISKEVLQRDVKLRIDDLEKDSEMANAVKHYDQLLIDYMRRVNATLSIQMAESPLVLA